MSMKRRFSFVGFSLLLSSSALFLPCVLGAAGCKGLSLKDNYYGCEPGTSGNCPAGMTCVWNREAGEYRCASGTAADGGMPDGRVDGTVPRCGNEVMEQGEQCDGNDMGGMKCDDLGFSGGTLGCTVICTYDTADCWAPWSCGNGIIEHPEECDGSELGGRTCQSLGFAGGVLECTGNCTFNVSGCVADLCGNGVMNAGEQCDDANNSGGDGCGPSCEVENGWQCGGEPTVCTTICGDGLVLGGEGCDDGNLATGDGCNQNCQVEQYWQCSGQPSTCVPICGDGHVVSGIEPCDDGNATNGDGCSSNCEIDCSNESTTDCNWGFTAPGSRFVDQSPPQGFVQCAGFINTTADDTNPDWEANCLGATRTLRVRLWDTTGNPWTLLADATLTPDSTPSYETQQFIPVNHGGSEGFYQGMGGVVLDKDDPNLTTLTIVPCDYTGDSNSDYGLNDMFAGNATDTKILLVCSADDDLIVDLCPVEWELLLVNTNSGNFCVDPATVGYTADLAIAIYFQVN